MGNNSKVNGFTEMTERTKSACKMFGSKYGLTSKSPLQVLKEIKVRQKTGFNQHLNNLIGYYRYRCGGYTGKVLTLEGHKA